MTITTTRNRLLALPQRLRDARNRLFLTLRRAFPSFAPGGVPDSRAKTLLRSQSVTNLIDGRLLDYRLRLSWGWTPVDAAWSAFYGQPFYAVPVPVLAAAPEAPRG
jgi:hypothetical protein